MLGINLNTLERITLLNNVHEMESFLIKLFFSLHLSNTRSVKSANQKITSKSWN